MMGPAKDKHQLTALNNTHIHVLDLNVLNWNYGIYKKKK